MTILTSTAWTLMYFHFVSCKTALTQYKKPYVFANQLENLRRGDAQSPAEAQELRLRPFLLLSSWFVSVIVIWKLWRNNTKNKPLIKSK